MVPWVPVFSVEVVPSVVAGNMEISWSKLEPFNVSPIVSAFR